MIPPLLAALAGLFHFVPEAVFPGLLPAAAALLLGAAALEHGDLRGPLVRAAAVWLCWGMLTLLWSVDRGQSAFTLTLWTGFVALPLQSRRTRLPLGIILVAGVLFCAVVSAWQLAVGFSILEDAAALSGTPEQQLFARQWAARGRVLGPFNSPDALAAMLITTLPVCLALMRTRAVPLLRQLAAVAVAVGGVTLVLTRSVGGVLSLSAAVVLVAGFRLHAQRRDRALMRLVLGALAPALIVVLWRLNHAQEPLMLSVSERFADWSNALSLMAHAPAGGVGAGAFESAFNAWSPQGRRYSAYAHNALLQTGVELGLVGLLALLTLYVGLVVWALRQARRGTTAEACAAVGVLAGCLHHQLDYSLHIASGAGLALAAAMLRMQRRAHSGPPRPLARGILLAGGCAAAWLTVGAALCERGIPRMRDDPVDLERTQRGALLLDFDARAQLALGEDLQLALSSAGADEDGVGAYLEAAERASRAAPLHPGGPMMRARMLLQQRRLPEALEAYNVAIARACCSRRLHEERKETARALGRMDVVEEDERWLEATRR